MRKHGLKNPVHGFITGPQCLACLKMFANRQKVIHHLCYASKGCLTLLESVFHPLCDDDIERVQSLESDKGALKSRPLTLCVQCAGPFLHQCIGLRALNL